MTKEQLETIAKKNFDEKTKLILVKKNSFDSEYLLVNKCGAELFFRITNENNNIYYVIPLSVTCIANPYTCDRISTFIKEVEAFNESEEEDELC